MSPDREQKKAPRRKASNLRLITWFAAITVMGAFDQKGEVAVVLALVGGVLWLLSWRWANDIDRELRRHRDPVE